ncbi:MAG: sigma-54-dependent Fis family transcriptional regulator [Candidatus Riflebacteria bacterium]|nr:sigma-54-dependent Fis family transcriptional regulator [Candidatus Riflebacteria bacterium]MBR4569056.1 sigma-54-dependent Fis family transcriptional regulator [Candidatus Riflebacteria bacterium]
MKKKIIGSSKAITEVLDLVSKVAGNDVTVLITGESGTGKEMVATAINSESSRKTKPYLKMNCAAIPSELLESQLFGHERGAFTGAISRQEGCFERANGGSLFLDEIGDMSMMTQTKLLRVLQEQEFERIGGSTTIKVDVRIMAATNKNLLEEIKKGRFREDLYYRLNVVEIHIPPLRERIEDIPEIVNSFLEEFKEKYNKPELTVSSNAMSVMTTYSWPGNVRELRNVIERATVLSRTNVIEPDDFPDKIRKPSKLAGGEGIVEDRIYTMAEMERIYAQKILEYAGGNKLKAARLLDIDPKTLRTKLGLKAEG